MSSVYGGLRADALLPQLTMPRMMPPTMRPAIASGGPV